MRDIRKMTDKELVEACVVLDKVSKLNKRDMDAYKAELQARGLQQMEDQNLRYVKFYGGEGTASVTDRYSIDVLNMDKLQKAIGEGLWKQKVKVSYEPKIKFDTKLERVLKAVFTGDYTFEQSLEEFLDELPEKPDDQQKKVLLRKLKGDYEKDRSLLISMFGLDQTADLDVELWYIYKIINGELIRKMLPEEGLDYTMQKIRECLIVESKVAVTIDYESDKNQSEEEKPA